MTLRTIYIIATIAALVCLSGCGKTEGPSTETPAAPPAAVTKVDPATAATITGKVTLAGKGPTRSRISMDAEPDCKALHSAPVLTEEVVTGPNGALANVFVYVKGGLEGKSFEPPAGSASLDQKGCTYRPHVFGVRAGQAVSIANSDPTTHNVHPMPGINREWNTSQPPRAANLERTFPRPEIMIPVKCNVHPWMKSYIGVVDHPFFAVTGEQGTFELQGLPPGDYTVAAWHEKYGTADQKVTLAAAATQAIEFSFKGE